MGKVLVWLQLQADPVFIHQTSFDQQRFYVYFSFKQNSMVVSIFNKIIQKKNKKKSKNKQKCVTESDAAALNVLKKKQNNLVQSLEIKFYNTFSSVTSEQVWLLHFLFCSLPMKKFEFKRGIYLHMDSINARQKTIKARTQIKNNERRKIFCHFKIQFKHDKFELLIIMLRNSLKKIAVITGRSWNVWEKKLN